MRRTDKEIESREEIDEIIRGCDVCRIAMAMGDVPYIVPVAFGYDGESIYIHTAREGKKINYFNNNNSVCFEFERNKEWVFGEENLIDIRVWKIEIASMTGKRSMKSPA
jgi:nitroimidazol reductase NimA-like FMN-containing flavoprotein (pyridoxamine 5'-phosphate oxidase superfamily)